MDWDKLEKHNLIRDLEKKEKEIKRLEEQVQMETMVKKSEVVMNKNLQINIEKLEQNIETLMEINEKYADKIGLLRNRLKKLILGDKDTSLD
tara:strand:- start:1524 stop:1799 length:276 start_codon:yes stop_codon:yes gene_type:complete